MNESPEIPTPDGALPTVNSSRIERLAPILLFFIALVIVPTSLLAIKQSSGSDEIEAYPSREGEEPFNISSGLPPLNTAVVKPPQACRPRFTRSHPEGYKDRFTFRGNVYYKLNEPVPRFTVIVMSRGFSCTVQNARERFEVYLPEGNYKFTVTDGKGRPNKYFNIYVRSDTSVNFMLDRRALPQRPVARIEASPREIECGGEPVILSWETKYATSVAIDQEIGTVQRSGKREVRPDSTKTYEISATNAVGKAYDRVRVVVSDSQRTPAAELKASGTIVNKGDPVSLSWTTENASTVEIEPGIGKVDNRGSKKIPLERTTLYKLTASNSCGKKKQVTVQVTVRPVRDRRPAVVINASQTEIRSGQKVKLFWETQRANSATIDPGGDVDLKGEMEVAPEKTTKYRLVATNSRGQESAASVTVTVFDVPFDLPVARLEASAESIEQGESVTLTWESENAKNYRLRQEPQGGTPIVEDVIADGAQEFTPEETTTYRFTASNDLGDADEDAVTVADEDVVTVRVTPTFDPTLLVLGGVALLLAGAWYLWPQLTKALSTAAGKLGGMGVAGQVSSAGDEVHCTLFSPPEVSAGTDLLVQIYAHLLEQAEELLELAQELEPDAKTQISKKLKKEVKRQSVLTFKLMVPGIELDEEEQDIVWDGEPEAVEFIIPIPADHPAGKRFGRVFVYNNGEEIGKIPFRINILPKELELAPAASEPQVAGELTQNPTAFVSYASRDKDKVYRFVQLMDVLKYDFHIDIFHIDAGERWEQKLYEFIDKDDVFLLFWSEAASQSEWVIKEAKLAKERMSQDKKGLPRIIIYKLDGQAEVPDWLQDIHVDRKWAEIIGSIETEAHGSAPSAG